MGRESLNYRRGRSGRPFERLKAHVYATETHCCICGLEVDLSLPYRDPITGKVNRMSKSIEHPTELDAGGHPYDGHLSHLGCNGRKGAQYRNAKHSKPTSQELTTSPDWQ